MAFHYVAHDSHILFQKLFNNDAKSNIGVCVPSVRVPHSLQYLFVTLFQEEVSSGTTFQPAEFSDKANCSTSPFYGDKPPRARSMPSGSN